MWVPDVYQGAPTSVTLLIGGAPKLAAFAITVRLLVEGMLGLAIDWQQMFVVLAVASLVIGNLAAIAQTNLKRMLAYSTISQMGFMLLGMTAGVVSGNTLSAGNAYSSAMFYVVTYIITTLGTFGLIMFLARQGFESDEIADLAGLARRAPWLAGVMSIFMFSLAGLPPSAWTRWLETRFFALAGKSAAAIFPTGAGKSLCYQLPALALPHLTLVISPLLALMHDQLRSARALGIRAASLTSVDADWRETQDRLVAGELDLLYVAPERASGAGFRDLLARANVALFAIDEAHCVSEWGHDFRPDYRLLRPLLDDFPDVPRLALTATADAHTRGDILAQLGIPVGGMIVAGFDRPNIRYAMSPRQGTAQQIADLVASTPGPGIVYAQTRMATEKLAEGIRAFCADAIKLEQLMLAA